MTRTDMASKTIPASIGTVYRALIDPEALVQWLPPKGMTARFDYFDGRSGGGYRMVLTYSDASNSPGKSTTESDVVDVRFLEIVPGVRIVQEVDFESDDPAFAGTMKMTWALSKSDEGTLVEIRADDVPTGISAADHSAGMESSLANLETYVGR